MPISQRVFRRALGRFASGVTVVTTRDAAGRALGLTVSSFCSVSLRPPLVLVCLGRRSELNAGMRESGRFAVSVLREDQEHVSRRFAARGTVSAHGLSGGGRGLPLVPEALAHVLCRVRSFHDEGDHIVWVGKVLAARIGSGRPLVYHRGRYRGLSGGGK